MSQPLEPNLDNQRQCVDSLPGEPHEANGKSPRCAIHQRQYGKWRNRRNKARERGREDLVEPYKPRSILPQHRDLLLSHDERGYLADLTQMTQAATSTVEATLRQGRPVQPRSLSAMLDVVHELTEALDQVLWPDPDRRRRQRPHRPKR